MKDTTNIYGINCTLYKLKNSEAYYYYFRYSSKVFRASTKCKDKADAQSFVTDLIHDLKHGLGVVPTSKRSEKTFHVLFDEYVEERQDNVSKTTLKNWLAVRPRILEHFGTKTENFFRQYDGDPKLWLDYEHWRKKYYVGKENDQVSYIKNGRKVFGRFKNFSLCPCSINKEISLVSQILNWHQRNGMFKNLDIPKFSFKDGVRKEEVPRIVYPTPEEYDLIKDYFLVDKNDRIKYLYFRMLCNSGMRPGESIKLRVDDVDYSSRVLWIRGRKTKSKKELKTGFPMVGKFRDIIDEILIETGKYRHLASEEHKNLLFINNKGKPIGVLSNLHQCLKNAIKEKKIENTRISLNSFRHLFVIKMVKQRSISLFLLAKMLGHKNINTLQNVYADYLTNDAVVAMENVYREIEWKKRLKEEEILNNKHKPQIDV